MASITFPSPLVGMFTLVALLLIVGDDIASRIITFYGPALDWIAKWLPLFYVPSLVTLPVAIQVGTWPQQHTNGYVAQLVILSHPQVFILPLAHLSTTSHSPHHHTSLTPHDHFESPHHHLSFTC